MLLSLKGRWYRFLVWIGVRKEEPFNPDFHVDYKAYYERVVNLAELYNQSVIPKIPWRSGLEPKRWKK